MTYETIRSFLESRLEGVYQGASLNQYNTRPLKLAPTPENAIIFNEIYQFIITTDMNILERSPSGSIRRGPKYLRNLYAYDIVKSSLGITLTISLDGYLRVIKFGLYRKEDAPEIYPTQAFKIFTEKCLEHGIDLEDYAISNGPEVRDLTDKAPIDMDKSIWDKTLTKVNHIDFHSSFPAGLANTHPEFRPVMEYFYDIRKKDPAAKFLMNSGIGFMCTEKFGFKARLAHLRKDAVEDNNRRIDELRLRLILSGRTIIGHNTDGIWYQGEPYHGPGEGKKLGEWENDHINCTFRAKGNGAYEFIENGVYNVVQRGQTTLDAVKPRDKWEWGDIYKTSIIGWKFDNTKGIYFNEV
jgi:hypothetical protein